MSWTIKGEAGKTLDATSRAPAAGLNISSCVLKFQSLAADTLVWTADTTAATGAGTIIPDFGQVVELYWNSDRKFRGHVTGIKVGTRQITVQVEGPWWWMERTNLTSDAYPYLDDDGDPAGTPAERAQYVFPTQSLATSIAALIARAITNGVPMTAGTVATMYDCPRMTLSEMSCANALATLMAWCPDSIAWFDYAGASPVLHITRRGVVAATTYTLGTDPVEIGEIIPRMDLKVQRNELHYVTRDATTGKPAWASQASGTAAAGTRQIVTVSGPEIVDFLPRDDFDSVTVQTANAAISAALVAQRDAGLSAIVRTYGYLPGTIADYINYYVTSYDPGAYNGRALFTRWFPVRYTITDGAGAIIPTSSSKKLVLTGDLPEWAMTQLGGVRVQITGTWVTTNTAGVYSEVEKAIQLGGFGFVGGWVYQTGSDTYYVSGRSFSISGILIDTAYLTPTVIYKPWDYDYLAPPAGLAAELVAAQNWIPWEGPLTIVADDVSGNNLLPYKYNLANGITPCTIMDALAKGCSHDLFRGRTTVDLGAPARLDFGTLVSRVRQDPKDNIVYL